MTHIISDNSRFSRWERYYFIFESWLNLLGGITIFLLVMLAVINALGRWLFNQPVIGYVDWVEQAMAVFAFLGLAYCQRQGGHIRMDIVLSLLKGRALWIIECISTLFMLVITAALVYGTYLHFYRAFSHGDSSMDIGLPIWPAKLIVPLALLLLVVRLLLQLWGYGRAFMRNDPHPAGVPMVEDHAAQAQREAAALDEE
ncbi:TRAP transporter small permease subunit [Gynuella sunshinyii]|uniref:TRAP transporter small permease protein n=1 Tax=Gynuella sunshinyii YC6258 TaxID=1445510 RepID=A0A0C5VTG9_9GAMM|nr:TRAP transporter small permease [Gynuella sunshinyii]AJQ97982.1 TRAP-type mannitol/chloroaromatic compound transport system, small permease component [Gynuella sunshinyii YC6258]